MRQVEEEARREAGRRVAQHPRGVHAAAGRRSRGGDDRVAGRAALGRHEGADHRPRGAQHPRAREHHRASTSSSTRLRRPSSSRRSTRVRREIAKLTLQKLVQDGRIHPARIEEAYYQAKAEIDNHVMEQGEQALFEANVHAMHPELVKLLGRLKFRTSYGQNVLSHSIEVVAARGDDRGRAGRERQDGPARGAAARHRQVRHATRSRARTPWSAASWRGATASPRRSRTRWRRTTTRSRCRPSRP